MTSPIRRTWPRINPPVASLVGIALNLLGGIWWTGPGQATSLEQYLAQVGNLIRRDVVVSLLSSAPSTLLMFGGVAAMLRRRRTASPLLGYLSIAIVLVAIVEAVLTVMRVGVTLIAIGTQDLDSPDFAITSPEWLTGTWNQLFLRGLNAFVLGLVLCLIGLVVNAAQEPKHQLEDRGVSGRRFPWIRPTLAVPLGLAIYVFGAMMSSFGPDRAYSLDQYVDQAGNILRRDALLAVFVLIPGYLLVFGGIAGLLRRWKHKSRLLGFFARTIVAVAVAVVVLDIAWVAVGLIAAGTQNLDSPEFEVAAPELLTDMWYPFNNLSNIGLIAGLAICFLGLIVAAIKNEP